MTCSRNWLFLGLLLVSGVALAATGIGTVTLVEGSPRLLRGATWYKLAAGVRVDEADILAAGEGGQMQVAFANGSRANLAGGGLLYLVPASRTIPLALALHSGWLKLDAKTPGLRMRTESFDLVIAEGALVARAEAARADFFIESGRARVIELTRKGGDGPARDAKRGEYWAKPDDGAFTTADRVPKAFVQAMPRHFTDRLPALAEKAKAKPALVVDHEITYAEAQPWLAGSDRAVFERRFASRLRDPEFRKAVEPDIAHYPVWDRRLHPDKYAPKDAPAK